jgi:hypothetical protein
LQKFLREAPREHAKRTRAQELLAWAESSLSPRATAAGALSSPPPGAATEAPAPAPERPPAVEAPPAEPRPVAPAVAAASPVAHGPAAPTLILDRAVTPALAVPAPPPRKSFARRHWWIFPVIGGVAAGLAIGLGVGLAPARDCGGVRGPCVDAR